MKSVLQILTIQNIEPQLFMNRVNKALLGFAQNRIEVTNLEVHATPEFWQAVIYTLPQMSENDIGTNFNTVSEEIDNAIGKIHNQRNSELP